MSEDTKTWLMIMWTVVFIVLSFPWAVRYFDWVMR